MTVPYLIENPPHQRQFRERGTNPSGVFVIHTAESTPDWVGPDTGAEAVARFIQGRSDFGSYHWLADSDSIVHLVPLHLQAYGDGTGSNSHAIHVSAATQAAKWDDATPEWRRETVQNMAAAAARSSRWLKKEHGITVPARKITKAQSDQRVPGLLAHGDRDPKRRTDPGKDFPWDFFLETFEDLMNPEKETPGITAVFAANGEEARRQALRVVMRKGSDEASKQAERWLAGIAANERADKKIVEARKALRKMEVK